MFAGSVILLKFVRGGGHLARFHGAERPTRSSCARKGVVLRGLPLRFSRHASVARGDTPAGNAVNHFGTVEHRKWPTVTRNTVCVFVPRINRGVWGDSPQRAASGRSTSCRREPQTVSYLGGNPPQTPRDKRDAQDRGSRTILSLTVWPNRL